MHVDQHCKVKDPCGTSTVDKNTFMQHRVAVVVAKTQDVCSSDSMLSCEIEKDPLCTHKMAMACY